MVVGSSIGGVGSVVHVRVVVSRIGHGPVVVSGVGHGPVVVGVEEGRVGFSLGLGLTLEEGVVEGVVVGGDGVGGVDGGGGVVVASVASVASIGGVGPAVVGIQQGRVSLGFGHGHGGKGKKL